MTQSRRNGPAVRQHVRLTIAGHGAYEARIDDIDDERIAVSLFVDPDLDVARAEAPKATIEFTSPLGLYRCAGVVHCAGSGDELTIEPWLGPQLLQRRDFARADALVRVVGWTDDGHRAFEARTLNISGGGFLLSGADHLRLGEVATFHLLPEGRLPVEARGRVVRSDDSGKRGVQIELIQEVDRESLVQVVFERQRRERMIAKGRG